jgi:hypothetical protein
LAVAIIVSGVALIVIPARQAPAARHAEQATPSTDSSLANVE